MLLSFLAEHEIQRDDNIPDQQQYVGKEAIETFENIKSPPKTNYEIVRAKSIHLLNSILGKVETSSSSEVEALEQLNKQFTKYI